MIGQRYNVVDKIDFYVFVKDQISKFPQDGHLKK